MTWDGCLHIVCQCDKCKAQPAPVQPSIKQGWDVDTLLDKPAAQRQWVGTVDCIGLALDLEVQAKRVKSQTVERAMLAAANGLRIIDKESKT